MTETARSAVGLVFITALVALTHIYFAPPSAPEEFKSRERREWLIIQALHIKKAPEYSFEMLEQLLTSQIESGERDWTVLEPAALFYYQENQMDKAKALVEELQVRFPGATSQALAYAVGLSDRAPEQGWEEKLTNDWYGARISQLIHQREGDQQAEMAARIRLNMHFERTAFSLEVITVWFTLGFFGLFVMVSMVLNHLRARSLGQLYFFLQPLNLPLVRVFRFLSMFFLSIFLVASAAGFLPGAVPNWVKQVLSYLLLMGAAWVLLRRYLFPGTAERTAHSLGLMGLRMNWRYISHIIAGMSLIVAAYYTTALFMEKFHWPFDQASLSLEYHRVMQHPFSAAFMMVFACVLAPFFEEVLFRGVVLRSFYRKMPTWLALSLASALFTVVHPAAVWPLVFAMGISLGLVYLRTGNVLVCIYLHALWNLGVLLLARVEIFV